MVEPPSAVPVDISLTTHGARIIDNEAPRADSSAGDSHDIYLPNYLETVSHIAVDIGGSLAKVVYFSHSSHGVASPRVFAMDQQRPVPQGTLTPTALLRQGPGGEPLASSFDPGKLRRRSLPDHFPGGRLNFTKFETGDIKSCVRFLSELIEKSARSNQVEIAEMRRSVKLMATGGGAHLFYDLFERELGVEVLKEDEMECLITGLNFMTLIPDEVFWYSDELVNEFYNSHQLASSTVRRGDSSLPSSVAQDLPRPSPQPPLYAPMFEREPSPKLPCLLVNIGSGVSILKVDENGQFERVSGTSLGGGTLWGLLGLLTDARNFDEMLEMCARGNNSNVDMLVGDIYGRVGLDHLGLKASTIASSFGKVFRWDRDEDAPGGAAEESARRRARFRQEDICRSLLYAISNNIGQIAHLNAEKYKLDRIYFGGCFIRGHQATISTLSYAIRFWSQGRRRAYFLRHEGYLGAVGAWVRHIGREPKHLAPIDECAVAEPDTPTSGAPVNAILAEALGGMSVDQAPARPAQRNAPESHTDTAAPATPPAADASAEQLLRDLEAIDEQELGDDPGSIQNVMAQLDRANTVADAIETRVNSLLGKLQELMPETSE
ncbi:pantothenate kinase [Malassezia obtusa]|uniref:Pantothenate kinase n=1 Tax=Malassezia obtusa TaxID=76774 RepID=A0AAF0E253_9BASI|nr:pantothenate kinase [Malassezia obtusa]